jgi:RNA polymerase sigma-70 factor (ECF subfamily)
LTSFPCDDATGLVVPPPLTRLGGLPYLFTMALPADPASSALDDLLSRFARLVRAVGVRHGLLDGDLDEVIQDVRIRLWQARHSGTIATAPSSYVYQTARSAALDLLRRRRAPHAAVSLDTAAALAEPAATARPDHRMERSELATAVFEAVEELIESRRVPVRMHLLGYEPREIAARLGWSGGKTRKLLSRGMADLRECLAARGIGPEGLT